MEVKVIRVKGHGVFSTSIDTEDIIKEMYAQGYTLKGVIPSLICGYGSISAVDLVFER